MPDDNQFSCLNSLRHIIDRRQDVIDGADNRAARDMSPSSSQDSELNERRQQNARVLDLQKQMEREKRKNRAKAKNDIKAASELPAAGDMHDLLRDRKVSIVGIQHTS